MISTYTSYADAQRAVDYLSDRAFPVERVSIVGHDLQYVERVTGRVGYGRAALSGAVAGAFFGALFGWIFGLFDWIDPLVSGLLLALYGLLFGAAFGALAGAAMHWATRGERDFSSVGRMQASRYDVLVDDEVADDAARLVAELGDSAQSTESATR